MILYLSRDGFFPRRGGRHRTGFELNSTRKLWPLLSRLHPELNYLADSNKQNRKDHGAVSHIIFKFAVN